MDFSFSNISYEPPRFDPSYTSSEYKIINSFCPDTYGKTLFSLLKRGNLVPERRGLFILPPVWLLQFKSNYSQTVKMLLEGTYSLLIQLNKEITKKPIFNTFHSKSGVIGKLLFHYVKEIGVLEKQFSFINKYVSFMRGETKHFPRKICDSIFYDRLKELSKTEYSLKLKNVYLNKEIHPLTHDYLLLFKLSKDLIEEILVMATSSNEVLNLLESYRFI